MHFTGRLRGLYEKSKRILRNKERQNSKTPDQAEWHFTADENWISWKASPLSESVVYTIKEYSTTEIQALLATSEEKEDNIDDFEMSRVEKVLIHRKKVMEAIETSKTLPGIIPK
ncbi:hypothetical protein RclHR1_01570025 [Rhizophagus clarus]|uniref:Uncharacterized protein n=1 Tax=Rhizophagus clarus TaxID=94130 RepID=A0A2Z6QFS7_9GLOM|nr:hypothetical protein RclHR1_01570025 [Rhizophagus clarus]GES90208.1 hypothetical protein RCL_jg13329.t1 [Rhizophagus clarus]